MIKFKMRAPGQALFGTLMLSASVIAVMATAPLHAQSTGQITRGTVTGQTTAPGYDHPDEYITMQDVKPADNMYPVIAHPDEEAQARAKLADLEKRTGKKPNIIIFLMDDVGWGDPGFNGGGEAVGQATPTMDRLANDGLIMTSAYSTPSCSPSRATIMTGQNPLHHGILRPPMYGEKGGLDGAITLPSVLKKLGYTTQGVGKWHMGENQGSLPQNVGFDDYMGFLGVSDEYTEWRDQYFNPEVALSPKRFKYMEDDSFNHNEVHCTTANTLTCDNFKLIELSYLKDLDTHWTNYSVDFIKRQANSPKPFFLYHATRGCHFDNYSNDKWAGKSRARTVYSDCIVEVDDALKQLVGALESTGQLDNTLIILSSDNGPECEIPPHAHTPFRGCKGSSWEGGVRVPTFAYWKGVIKPRRTDGLFDQADLFNTMISLAGKPQAQVGQFVPKTTYIDGVDQVGMLVADNGQSARRSRIYTMNQYFSNVRVDEFKYVFTAEIENGFFQKGDWGGFSGPIAVETGGAAVVNLYTNPQEDVSAGVRHIPMAVPVLGTAGWYYKELMKYPPQFKVGFISNNPPMYVLAPLAKAAAEKAKEAAMQPEKNPRPQ